MGIFLLKKNLQAIFAEAPEIFAAVQFGRDSKRRNFLVLGCQVAIELDKELLSQLENFFETVWATPPLLAAPSSIPSRIVERYDAWLESLQKLAQLTPVHLTRQELAIFVAGHFPPPPPNRPTVVPAAPVPPPLPPNYYGHLPFVTTTDPHETFYRFEPWPTSRKITLGDPGSIANHTYASPSSELPFLPTGFAAVARNALPSFFPAVFRYELQPVFLASSVVARLRPTTANRAAALRYFSQHRRRIEALLPTQ
jgi:hypothetical protein